MNLTDAEMTIAQILEALDAEREMIRTGHLNGLADLVENRERAIANLDLTNTANQPVIVQGVAEISKRAKRNAGLLEAAIEGVKAAEKRLSEIYEARNTLGTYERDGTKSIGPVNESTIKKRA